MTRCLVNGEETRCLPVADPGFLHGLNCFDTLRTYGSIPFRLAEHVARLEASAASMGIPCPTRSILEDLDRVTGVDRWLRVTLTAGGNRVVQSHPIDPSRIGRPLDCARLPVLPNEHLAGSVKHGSRAAWVLSAQKLGVDEVLFEHDGQLLEANRSSIVAVVGGELVTPPTDGRLLDGVTRGALLDAAAEAGLPMRVAPLPSTASFDELYVASTLKELAPVRTLDGIEIGGGGVGKALHVAFRGLVARETQSTLA